MFNNGKACTTDSERTVPYCGPKPQLKDGVEHDCYIYTRNSACTMEGIDIVMVRNTLLNNLQSCFGCAGCFCLQNGEWRLGVHCYRFLADGYTGRTGRGWNHCCFMEADRRAHSAAGLRLREAILCVRLTAYIHLCPTSRPWLFWVKQSRQWRLRGRHLLYDDSSADAGAGGFIMRATGCYRYRVGP